MSLKKLHVKNHDLESLTFRNDGYIYTLLQLKFSVGGGGRGRGKLLLRLEKLMDFAAFLLFRICTKFAAKNGL